MNKKKILIIVTSLVIFFGIYLVISLSNKKTNTQTNIQNTTKTTTATTQNEVTSSAQTVGIVIKKSEITNVAKFYQYKSGNTNMEIMAVKATDGTIRTALNTCQVCYDSGRGYYKQEGDFMVCQNCGNKFNLNQIEKIKGGCNPVPILAANKTDNTDTITISKEYLDSQKSYFANWKE